MTYPPANRRVSISQERETEFEPVRDDDTKDVESELEGNKGTPRSMTGDLKYDTSVSTSSVGVHTRIKRHNNEKFKNIPLHSTREQLRSRSRCRFR